MGSLPLMVRVVAHPTIWICSTVAAVMLKEPAIMVAPIVASAAIEGEVSRLFNG